MTDLAELLEADAAALGYALAPHEQQYILAFTELLARWNRAVRLAGPSDPAVLLREQVVEALAYRPLLAVTQAWWDIGSGGGLPALVLAGLMPEHVFHLVEPIGKKVAFLKQAALTLGVSSRVSVHAGRLEAGGEVPPSARALRDRTLGALSRATFAPELWHALAFDLVGPSGHVIIASAARLEQPFAEQARAAGTLVERIWALPATGAPRCLSRLSGRGP